MVIIEIEDLRVTRNQGPICSVAQMTVNLGDRVAVLGQNGSGKSTLLRVLSGLERDYDGTCIVELKRKDRVYVDQDPYLFRGTVLFNAMYGLRARGLGRARAESMALQWLDKLGIAALAGSRVQNLSGGERRRTALARAMAIRPKLLLLDEPFSEMDRQGTARIEKALIDLSDTTILLASPTPVCDGVCGNYHQMA